MDKPELQEGHEGRSVAELLQDTHRTANLDAMEPLALLSLYAAQTRQYNIMPRVDSGWSLPEGEQCRAYCWQRDAALV